MQHLQEKTSKCSEWSQNITQMGVSDTAVERNRVSVGKSTLCRLHTEGENGIYPHMEINLEVRKKVKEKSEIKII